MINKGMDHELNRPRFWRSTGFWTGVGIFISLVVGVPALWLAFLAVRPADPKIVFEAVNTKNVIDVNKPVEDLRIVFRDEEINEELYDLRILTIRVENVGDVDIHSNHYDDEYMWGMKFDFGELIDVKLIDSSSEYLSQKLDVLEAGSDSVTFPKLIFEKDEFFVIDALILHPNRYRPSVQAFGKVAGIEEITVLNLSPLGELPSFWETIFPGDFFDIYFRTLFYLVGFAAVIMAFAGIMTGLATLFSEIEQKRRLDALARTNAFRTIEDNRIKDFLAAKYGSSGSEALEELQRIVEQSENVEHIEVVSRWRFRGMSDSEDGDVDEELETSVFDETLEELMRIGVLETKAEAKAEINPEFRETLSRLMNELRT